MGKAKSKNRGAALWGARLVDGEIIIRSRHGRIMNEEDLKLVKILLATYWLSQSHADGGSNRPQANDEVETKGGLKHTFDPIVRFFIEYRVRRRLSVSQVAERMGMSSGGRLTALENGRVRPLVEVLRDWGMVLGFVLLPVPIPMVPRVREEVNRFIDDQYLQDLQDWGDDPPNNDRLGGKYADLSASGGFLRGGEDSGSPEAEQAAG
jgi:transcriptional regulator with XRE-family HTH domain